MWLGLALILAAGIAHIWLEFDRGTRIASRVRASQDQVVHTFEVIDTAQSLRAAVQDAERGQRGFLLTSNPAYLDTYRRGVARAPAQMARLKQLTADNPEQQRRWPVLEQQLGVKLATLADTLDVNRGRGPEAARKVAMTNAGFDAMGAVNGLIDAAIDTERDLLGQRLARADEIETQARRTALAGALLAFAVLLLGVAAVLLGLNSLRKAEAARHEADQRYRFFVSSVTDYAIYMLDPQGNVVEWNAGAERIKGYAAEEILGRHFSLFYTPEDREAGKPQRALDTALKEGKYEEEAWRVRKDGKRFLASVLIEPLLDRSGRLAGFAKVTRDIDERVQERQALAQYQKMDAIGQLTGGIAHDFNNLLHVIKNAADLVELRLRDAGPEIRGYIEMLKRNADRAASLTQRLLAFSRRQVLDPKPVNPNSLVVDVTTLLRQVLGEGVAIETVVSPGVWWISVDVNQLETAMLNLALNARDAMGGVGKLTIEISNAFLDESYARAHAEVNPGQYVMIAISDTGSGMEPEVVARAFEPFFTTKSVGQGTGLGLSQVYGFIKQSQGHAKIYSEPGAGATVKLYLPRLPSTPEQETAPRTAPALQGGQGGTILLVEDDRDVREFTAELLGTLGYRVLTAIDAAAALIQLQAEPDVALLFTDIGLPGGMNGRQLADEAQSRRPGLRVLFTTGYTRNAIIHHGRLDPGVNVILKPYTQAGLAQKVKEVLDGQGDAVR